MNKLISVVFAISLFLPIYTYAIYPFILKILAGFRKKKYIIDEQYQPYVSVLVAAYNEEKVIAGKIENMLLIDYPADKIEFLIGSDGSSDRTVEIARRYSHISNLRILDLPRGGKVNALNCMLKEANGDVLVFSDANTMYDSKAILNLVKYFIDERIGCVSGQVRLAVHEKSGMGARSENTYWKYENWVKVLESNIGRLSGANGAIYAIRKGLVPEIRKGIINDDFYVSTYILQAGYDVIFEDKAIAYEEPNDEFVSQFKRHTRDGAGHYQAIAVFWPMLFPRKGSFVHVSHRVIRWIVPFLLMIAFMSNTLLVAQSWFMLALFVCQVLAYLILVGYYFAVVRRGGKLNGAVGKLISIIFYFMSVNLALFLGWIRLIRKQQKATWETLR